MSLVKLSTICNIQNGYAFKSKNYKTKGVPLLRISNFEDGNVIIDDKTIYIDEYYLKSKSEFIVEKGDILIALSGATTGKYGIYNFDYPSLLNQRIGLLKSGRSKHIDSKYFFYYLSILKDEILRKAGGAAQPNISTKTIGEFRIPLPPLAEQKRIATILDKADALRQKSKAQLAAYDELLQATFLELFGDPVSNPKGWEKIELLHLINNIDGGWSPQCDRHPRKSNNNWAILTLSSISQRDYKEKFNKNLPSSLSPKQNIEVKRGDLLFSRKNTKELVGACAFVFKTPPKLLIPDTIFRINYLPEKTDGIFLFYLFNSRNFRKNIQRLATGSAGSMPNISKEKLKKLHIPTPPLTLQSQFAKIVENIEAQKSLLKQSIQESEDLFNGLVQTAFRGEL